MSKKIIRIKTGYLILTEKLKKDLAENGLKFTISYGFLRIWYNYCICGVFYREKNQVFNT